MPKLQQAGIVEKFVTWLSPKRLTAHVRKETLANGKVQIVPVFEVEGRGEVPANLVGSGTSQTIRGFNVYLDATAQRVHEKTQGKPTLLSKKKAGEFLLGLEKAGVSIRTKDGRDKSRIAVVKPNVTVTLGTDDALSIESDLTTSDGIVLEKPVNLSQLHEDEGWFSAGDDLVRVATSETELDQILLLQNAPEVLGGDSVPKFLKLLENNASNLGDVEKNEALQNLAVFGKKTENRAKVDGNANSISISPTLVVHGPRGSAYEESPEAIEQFQKQGGGFQRVPDGWIEMTPETMRAHQQACEELNDQIGNLGEIEGLEIPKTLAALFARDKRAGWSDSPWTVYFSQAVKDAHRLVDTPADVKFHLNIVERDGRSLLELDPMYNHERFKLSHAEVEQIAAAGEEWLRRDNAWVKIDTDKYKKVNASASNYPWMQKTSTGFEFPASERERAIEIFSILGSIQHSASYADFVAKLADFEKIDDVPLPKCLRTGIAFRPYQKHGYNWLAFLHRFGLNGILADDMGLGKTLQTLAVIQYAREKTSSRFPTLIICPTSVVQNWKAEVQKFFNDTCVIQYTGTPKGRERKLKLLDEMLSFAHMGLAGPIVVTSYAVARLEHEKLNKVPWLYVVVDEGHNIKNPDAQTTRAVKTINGQHKLALTGTPIQNNLEELWSLFDYAMPGFLGNRANFRTTYSTNGRPNWDAVRGGKAPLKERIHPFIMRRLKENVAKDLPTKTLIDLLVKPSNLQIHLYKEVLESMECQSVRAAIERDIDRAKFQMFPVLARLRSICNHPVLADVSGEPKCEDSGKLEALKDLMEAVISGGPRALLFSQRTEMLDIIETFFTQWNVRMMRLDGNTPPNRRQSMVDEFNRDTSVNCFLISTKAGGTGLNLIGADTVIFYDHDWNPAQDLQAQDRAYRIGQEKPVNVYRLITKGTIEEKIIERQKTKQDIADQIIGADEEGFKDLTKEELLSLFSLDTGERE